MLLLIGDLRKLVNFLQVSLSLMEVGVLLASHQYLMGDAEAVGLWRFFFHSFSSKKLGLEHGTPKQGTLMWSLLSSQVATAA